MMIGFGTTRAIGAVVLVISFSYSPSGLEDVGPGGRGRVSGLCESRIKEYIQFDEGKELSSLKFEL